MNIHTRQEWPTCGAPRNEIGLGNNKSKYRDDGDLFTRGIYV